jgi:hypothetical protein
MLTERDREIIKFVEKFGSVSTSQIETMFFVKGSTACRRRLGILCDKYKVLKKAKRNMGAENVYYIDRLLRHPDHRLRLTDFYIKLKKFDIKRFDVEPVYEKVIPDAYVEVVLGSDLYKIFVEIHMSYGRQAFDQAKYETLYETWLGSTFPRIVIVSERAVKLEPTKLRYIKLLDGYKISEIFR